TPAPAMAAPWRASSRATPSTGELGAYSATTTTWFVLSATASEPGIPSITVGVLAFLAAPCFAFGFLATDRRWCLTGWSGLICVTAALGELCPRVSRRSPPPSASMRSEEHTSELQSPDQLVCR